MKLTLSIVTLLTAITSTVSAATARAGYDEIYNSAGTKTLTLACSDGQNGLATKGYSTLGLIPRFPYVGATPDIEGWNSKNCGACYSITYAATKKTIYVTGVDTTRGTGNFVLSTAALNKLTNNQAIALGTVSVTWSQVPRSRCGM